MDKIVFEDGTKISNAKVIIDGVEYIVIPAQYSGNTPFSAHNLNLMQSNIESAIDTKANALLINREATTMKEFVARTANGNLQGFVRVYNVNNFLQTGTEEWYKGTYSYQNSVDDTVNEVGGTLILSNVDGTIYFIKITGFYNTGYSVTTRLMTQDYSMSEIPIGKWINGKTIYRKVIMYNQSSSTGQLNNTTVVNIPHNIQNLDIVVNITSFDEVGRRVPALQGNTVDSGIFIYSVNSSNIQLRILNAVLDARIWYFILEYTKTT